MLRRPWLFGLLAAVVGLAPSLARAGDADDEGFFSKVMSRLLSTDLVKKEYQRKYHWPPKYFIKPSSAKELNAYATASEKLGAVVEDGKIRPVVMITEGYMKKVVKGDENVLAAIMGHELAHLTRDHVGDPKGDTLLLFLAYSRDHEIEADLDGMRYAVAAGFPYKESVASAFREMKASTTYTSFEGLHTTHPSWEERLSFLDREQSKLWSAMSAFNNGNLFLELEQYPAAEQCFRAVVKEFPECHEAWANLGYTLLMRYCDALEPEDLRSFGIGHVVAGCFYTRPTGLESKVRGIDEKAWHGAVKALKAALALKEDLVLPRACLGIAHLVHPEGKDTKQASRFFAQALTNFRKDRSLTGNYAGLMSLLINAGVADMASGDRAGARELFLAADKISVGLGALGKTLDEALVFNLAMWESEAPEADVRKAALKKWTFYLMEASPDSSWWPVAYERYARLARELEVKAISRAEFLKGSGPAPLRMVTSVLFGSKTIFLSEPIEQVVEDLGKDEVVSHPLYPGAKIQRWRFDGKGIEFLGKDKVLAIFLNSPKSPPVQLQAVGSSTKAREVRVGMSEKEAEELLKDQRAEIVFLTTRRERYRFYPGLGLALRYHEDRIVEMALARVPRVRETEKVEP